MWSRKKTQMADKISKSVQYGQGFCTCSTIKKDEKGGKVSNIFNAEKSNKSPYCKCSKGRCPLLTRSEIGTFVFYSSV